MRSNVAAAEIGDLSGKTIVFDKRCLASKTGWLFRKLFSALLGKISKSAPTLPLMTTDQFHLRVQNPSSTQGAASILLVHFYIGPIFRLPNSTVVFLFTFGISSLLREVLVLRRITYLHVCKV